MDAQQNKVERVVFPRCFINPNDETWYEVYLRAMHTVEVVRHADNEVLEADLRAVFDYEGDTLKIIWPPPAHLPVIETKAKYLESLLGNRAVSMADMLREEFHQIAVVDPVPAAIESEELDPKFLREWLIEEDILPIELHTLTPAAAARRIIATLGKEKVDERWGGTAPLVLYCAKMFGVMFSMLNRTNRTHRTWLLKTAKYHMLVDGETSRQFLERLDEELWELGSGPAEEDKE